MWSIEGNVYEGEWSTPTHAIPLTTSCTRPMPTTPATPIVLHRPPRPSRSAPIALRAHRDSNGRCARSTRGAHCARYDRYDCYGASALAVHSYRRCQRQRLSMSVLP